MPDEILSPTTAGDNVPIDIDTNNTKMSPGAEALSPFELAPSGHAGGFVDKDKVHDHSAAWDVHKTAELAGVKNPYLPEGTTLSPSGTVSLPVRPTDEAWQTYGHLLPEETMSKFFFWKAKTMSGMDLFVYPVPDLNSNRPFIVSKFFEPNLMVQNLHRLGPAFRDFIIDFINKFDEESKNPLPYPFPESERLDSSSLKLYTADFSAKEYIFEDDFNIKLLMQERALEKLSPAEIEALGLQKFAIKNKLKNHKVEPSKDA